MIQRKFKHKSQPIWAVQCASNSETFGIERDERKLETSIDRLEGECLSRRYLEKSPDWQEINEPELVEGRWYVTEPDGTEIGRLIMWDISVDGFSYLLEDFYAPNDNCLIYRRRVWVNHIEREATSSEIHQALDAIRIEKGLVEGTKLRAIDSCEIFKLGNLKDIRYNKNSDWLYIITDKSCVRVYEKGEWTSKIESPVLVTEEDYEIFENETLFKLDTCELKWVKINCHPDITTASERFKFFKYQQNAEKYIENHKPRFSRAEYEADLNQIKEKIELAYDDLEGDKPTSERMLDELNKIIKQLKKRL